MKTSTIKKLLIITILLALVILLIVFTKKTAYEIVEEKHDLAIDYQLISSKEMDDSLFVYSSGKINDNKDNIYYIDMLKKTLMGYKWIGGGGHINHDIVESNKDFIISIQVLDKEHNITPTAFGIIRDKKVIDVIIDTPRKLTNATIYDGRDVNEKFYAIHIDSNIADIQSLIVRIMYTGGSEVAFSPSEDEMERLQKGEQIYIKEESLIGDKEIDLDDSSEKIIKESKTPEGYRLTEYKDGYTTIFSREDKLDIVKSPKNVDLTRFPDYKPEELPKKSGNPFMHDLRSKDISHLDLSGELDYLLMADFDDHTIWPDSLPKEYDIEKIAEYGMDPGLGIRRLHEEGITGKGVGIAIIDQTLLVGHVEYKNQLKLYEEVHNIGDFAQMHGPALASIAVGKNVGVAPGADLYYIANTQGVYKEDLFEWNLYWLAKSIDRIIEINKSLAEENKIAVISISLEIERPKRKNLNLVIEAIDRAADEGIYTISGDNSLWGSGRDPLGNPNEINSYKKGYFWKDYDYSMLKEDTLVPMDSRYLASLTGEDKYAFYRSGGLSWAVPYTAGLYALSCQVDPNITPERFNDAIAKTARKISLNDSEDRYKIVDPQALINEIKKSVDSLKTGVYLTIDGMSYLRIDKSEKTFVFQRAVTSYRPSGNYTIDGDNLLLHVNEDAEETIEFKIDGDILIFESGELAEGLIERGREFIYKDER